MGSFVLFIFIIFVVCVYIVLEILSWIDSMRPCNNYTSCGIPYQKCEPFEPYVEPFSPITYMERIQNAHEEILHEKELKKEPSIIILWWGLEGIQLNEDGSLQWVKKRKPEQPKNKTQNDILALMQMVNSYKSPSDYIQYQGQNFAGAQNVATQIINSQIQSLQFAQAFQTKQMCMISALNSYRLSPYYSYFPYYYSCSLGGYCYGQQTQYF